MTDHMLPIIRQMHDAATDARRAEILLECPLLLLIKYRDVFEKACQKAGFEAGLDYLLQFSVAMHQTRFRGALKSAGLSHATGVLILLAEGAQP